MFRYKAKLSKKQLRVALGNSLKDAEKWHKIAEHNCLKYIELKIVAQWLYNIAWGSRYDLERDAKEAGMFVSEFEDLRDCHDMPTIVEDEEMFDEWIKDN